MAFVGLLLVVGLVAAPPPTVSATGRVALVVGNSTYAHIGRLPNPGRTSRLTWRPPSGASGST